MEFQRLSQALEQLDIGSPRYATEVVEKILAEAQAAGASDIHFQPGATGWSCDGGSTAYCSRSRSCRRRSRPTSSPGSRCWPSS